MVDDSPTTTHAQFSAQDADITIKSADGILFNLHRKNLEVNTGVFPGAEFDVRGEQVVLPESGKVLEILFQFVYPKRYPTLKNLDFEMALTLAEAAEKYEIYSAVNACNGRLRDFLPQHATEIFIHAIKHNETDLLDEAALLLSRSPQQFELLVQLPQHYILPWIQYRNAWHKAFENSIRYIENNYRGDYTECRAYRTNICRTCRAYLIVWVTDLERLGSLSAVQRKIEEPTLNASNHKLCGCCTGDCKCLESVADDCKSRIRAIPAFTHFLVSKNL